MKYQLENLVALLIKISIEIGMKSLPESMQKSLCQFIMAEFHYMELEEIEKAFNMAFAGKLGIDTNVYGTMLTKLYVGKILSAYAAIRKNERQYRQKLPVLKSGSEEANRRARDYFMKQLKEIQKEKTYTRLTGVHYRMIDKHLYSFTTKEKKDALRACISVTRKEIDHELRMGEVSTMQVKHLMSRIETDDRNKYNAMIYLAKNYLENNKI